MFLFVLHVFVLHVLVLHVLLVLSMGFAGNFSLGTGRGFAAEDLSLKCKLVLKLTIIIKYCFVGSGENSSGEREASGP